MSHSSYIIFVSVLAVNEQKQYFFFLDGVPQYPPSKPKAYGPPPPKYTN